MKRHRISRSVLAAAALTVSSRFAHAATTDYFWNAPNGGTGNWDTSTSNWATAAAGPVNYIWTNNASERPNFQNTAGTVSIIAPSVTAAGIIFGTTGYTIAGNPLDLAAAAVTTSGAATISAPITGSVGLTEGGGGTLTLNAANNYSGTTTVNTSTLVGVAQASGSPFSSGAVTVNAATLNLTGIASSTTTTVGTFTVGTPGGSNLIIDNTTGGSGVTTTLSAGALTRGGVGSVLAITPKTGNLATGTGTGEAVTVSNGGTLVTNTILPAWVLAQAQGSNVLDFTTYGANGVAIATYSPNDLTTSSSTDVVNQTNDATLSADASAYALRANQSLVDLATHTLNLGNGSGQTGLIVNDSAITDGNINFGATEGVIAVSGTGVLGSTGNSIASNDLTIHAAGGATVTVDSALNPQGTLTFTGGGNVHVDGPVVVSGANRTYLNTITAGSVTFGASAGSSTITLGGVDGIGRTLTVGATAVTSANTTTIINDVIQDPAAGGGTHSGSVTYIGGNPSTIQINAHNTYTGPTTLGGTTNAAIQLSTSSSNDGLSGPFGASSGALIFNNTANNQLQPISGSQTVANPITLNFGWTVSNVTGDTTSGLTFTGAIAEVANGRTLTNNLASANTLVVGSSTSPSTLTLSSVAGQGTTIGGTGNTIFYDTIQDGTASNNLTVSATGTTTFNGNINSNGSLTVSSGNGVVVFNGIRSGTGAFTISSTTTSGGIIYLNTQNTYNGTNTLSDAAATVRIGASSNGVGAAATAGPFGTGSLTFNNSGAPPILQAFGANRQIANPITIDTSGFFTNTNANPFSLTFTGAIGITTGRVITNNMASAAALILGDPTTPSTLALGSKTITLQTQAGISGAGGGRTIINDAITGTGGLTIQNAAIVQYNSAANNYSGTTTVRDAAQLKIAKSYTTSGTMTLNTSASVNGGKVTLLSDGTHNVVLKTNTLNITSSTGTPSELDVTDNKAIVHGGTLSTVNTFVATGRNGGAWNGTGIVTSTADAQGAVATKTLGVVLNSDLGAGATKTTWGGVSGLASNDVLVMYTYAGDENLDGRIDGDDYSYIDAGFNSAGALTGYEHGDLNYDGLINADDYFLIDRGYAENGAQIATAPVLGGAAPMGLSGVSAVPEPTSLGMLAISTGVALGARRRRKK